MGAACVCPLLRVSSALIILTWGPARVGECHRLRTMSVGIAGGLSGRPGIAAVYAAVLRHGRQSLLQQRTQRALWAPVLFGVGIAVYFAITVEPPRLTGPALFFACLAGLAAAWRWPVVRLLLIGSTLLSAGFAVAQWRTHAVAAPVLSKPYGPGWVTGHVVSVDRQPKGDRVVLERPVMQGLAPEETPERVRIRLRRGDEAVIGSTLRVRARVMPPSPPVMPGAFDFQRHAWFAGIGGLGFAYTHAESAPDPVSRPATLASMRLAIAERIRDAIPGTAGAVAAALIVGDRSAIPEETMVAMRHSGLAHLLAISGLHIGLVAATIFFATRLLLAAIEPVALRWPTKKIAAAVALAGAFAYLLMAGATVPTQRAFVMTGIVLIAVLLDRTAISLRLVAWAAMIVLLIQPESLMSPSFQMSFAAVIALVAVYEGLRPRWRGWRAGAGPGRRLLLYLTGLGISTLVAGTATGLIAIYHFGRFSAYGLVANLIAVPIVAFWVMPWAVLACILMPFGLEQLALVPMAWGIDAVLATAETVGGWPGSSIQVKAMPGWGLAAVAVGGLWLCLWRGRARWIGLSGIVAGLLLTLFSVPPTILIDGEGRLIALRTPDGSMSLSSGRTARFAAGIWMERAGVAHADRWPKGESPDGRMRCDALGCIYDGQHHKVAFVRDARAFADDCAPGMTVVSMVPARWHCRSAGTVVDRFDLWRNGAHAIWLREAGIRVLSVREARGDRLWAPPRKTRMRAADKKR